MCSHIVFKTSLDIISCLQKCQNKIALVTGCAVVLNILMAVISYTGKTTECTECFFCTDEYTLPWMCDYITQETTSDSEKH